MLFQNALLLRHEGLEALHHVVEVDEVRVELRSVDADELRLPADNGAAEEGRAFAERFGVS